VSRQLAACEVIVFPDPSGPSSRKTSLAAALAHGKPVVALDGAQTWRELVDAGAVVVGANRDAMAVELGRLMCDRDARSDLGARARAFSEGRLSAELSAKTVLKAITGSSGGDPKPAAPSSMART